MPGADVAADKVVTDRHEEGLSPTLDGSVFGTPAYMAPEQARGEIDQLDERSDIYSLGAILYELLTLERAVDAPTPRAALARHTDGDIVPPQRRAPGRQIPRELSRIVMKCLASRREDRYRSVTELRKEVGIFLEGREAWLPVCSMDFQDGRLDERFDAVLCAWDAVGGDARIGDASDRFVVTQGELRSRLARGGCHSLQWRQELGEDVKVAVTLLNTRDTGLRLSVSGDSLTGYRVGFGPYETHVSSVRLETVANGYWEVLQNGLISLDTARPSWDIVVERSGPWIRATVDGVKAIDYYDPLPLSGPGHRTFSLGSQAQPWAITRLQVWRRRAPEVVSVLDAGRVLLQLGHVEEAARFFEGQMSTPRDSPVDDEARFLHALCQERLGRMDDAIASYRALSGRGSRFLDALASLRVASILVRRGQLAAAGRAARRAADLGPGLHAADTLRHALAELMRDPVPGDPPAADPEGLAALADAIDRRLDCQLDGTRSVEPIAALPLTSLVCIHGPLSDLSPLKGMPLTRLDCNRTQVADLTPLQGMRLTRLNCELAPVSDLSPLNGMPLTHLNCVGTRVSDLSPLKGMSLRSLDCSGSLVSDLNPLKGMPLDLLNCVGTRVSDLSPLKGAPLTTLFCSETPVCDLDPLRGMPLESLDCRKTHVRDLTPLKGMPIWNLSIGECEGITDLTPLEGMELKWLVFTAANIVKGMEVIRAMKGLTLLTGFPGQTAGTPEEFWSLYDAGEFRK